MNDLIYASAKTIARAIQTKEVSSREIVESCLQRIEQVNPELNAVVQIDEESALKEAKEAVEAIGRKNRISAPEGSGCLSVLLFLAVIVAGITATIAATNL